MLACLSCEPEWCPALLVHCIHLGAGLRAKSHPLRTEVEELRDRLCAVGSSGFVDDICCQMERGATFFVKASDVSALLE